MHTGHSRHSSLASDKISSLERNFRHRKAWTLPKNVKFTVPVNDDSMGKRSSYGTLQASHTSVQARPLASRCSPKRVFNMLVILQNVRNVLSETGLHILCRVKLDLGPATRLQWQQHHSYRKTPCIGTVNKSLLQGDEPENQLRKSGHKTGKKRKVNDKSPSRGQKGVRLGRQRLTATLQKCWRALL